MFVSRSVAQNIIYIAFRSSHSILLTDHTNANSAPVSSKISEIRRNRFREFALHFIEDDQFAIDLHSLSL